MPSSYPARVLFEAVHCLATGNAPPKKRLKYAAISLCKLDPEDFADASLRREFEELMFWLTADPRSDARGSLETTIDTMTDNKLTETIERILSLYAKASRLDPDDEFYK